MEIAVKCAQRCKDIDKTVVTTDYDYNHYFLHVGAHFVKRPESLCTADASSWDVVEHALESIGASSGDVAVLLQPTSPFRSPDDIAATLELGSYSAFEHETEYTTNGKPYPNGAVYVYGHDFCNDPHVMPEERSIDIDTEFDLKIARAIYEYEKQKPGTFNIWYPR